MSRILVVEDEQHIADGLRFNLEAEGHEVSIATTGEQALASILDERRSFDIVVLDVMLPGCDGFAVAAALRTAGQFLPILMLTARNRPEDVLRGFEAGADDYLPKPFELAILIARINGLLRRRLLERGQPAEAAAPPPRDVYSFAGRTLDFAAMEVQARGKSYRLTQMECDLLRYLVTHAGPASLARRAARRRLGPARADRHARHRQLHRPFAEVSRRSSRRAALSSDRPRRRLQVRARRKMNVEADLQVGLLADFRHVQVGHRIPRSTCPLPR